MYEFKCIFLSLFSDSVKYNYSSQQRIGELFAPEFDKASCLSRYDSILYRKPSPHKPSPYLLSRLRKYESLHKRCGPYTQSYNRTLEKLKPGLTVNSMTDCNYVVYTTLSGLGNRMLAVASAFLFALLTNRVLLVEYGPDTNSLFCEPFPNTTWLLPMDFPLRNQFGSISQDYPRTYGNMLKNNLMVNTSIESSLPSFLYLYLAYNIDHFDGLFYCDQNQAQLKKVPWLAIKSNQYFVPSLFLVPSFKNVLNKLFPNKETVFHHLGGYLFQPSNEAWGLITRFYQAYLAKADEKIGIQVRVFDTKATPFQTVMDQILSCTLNEKLLPQVDVQKSAATPSNNQSLKAVLIASLHSQYYEHIKGMYWTRPTVTGDVIGIYQPSHDEYEQYGDKMQSMKAWAEMNLLSMSDVLVTSSWSTFGYVAQGLGGLKPWILYRPVNSTTPDPPCRQAMSMEPCFHFPPSYDCKRKVNVDTGALVAHVKHCEDVGWGLKLVNDH